MPRDWGFSIPNTLRVREPSVLTGAVGATLAPLADLGDELEVAHELVVDEVVVAAETPQEIRPCARRPSGELIRRGVTMDGLLEVRLEVLELGEGLPSGVHLDVEVLGPHVLAVVGSRPDSGRRRNQTAGLLGIGQACPGRVVASMSWNRSWIASSITSIDWMVGSCRQRKRYQGWSLIQSDGAAASAGERMLDEALAEHPRALAGGVGEARPAVLLGEVAGARGDVPVEQEQRGEALLTVERLERPVARPRRRRSPRPTGLVARRRARCESTSRKSARISPDRVGVAALGVVALDQRDLDALDGDGRRRLGACGRTRAR